MAWIQVDDSIREHDKIYRLADILNIPDAYAVGLMVCFWAWAATAAPDGNVTEFPARAVAAAAKWKKGANKFYDALLEARFLEKQDEKVVIRNWDQRATLLMEYMERQKENTRKRVQRYREKKEKRSEESGNVTGRKKIDSGNVTVTLQKRDVTHIPESTLPESTIYNSTAKSYSSIGNVTDNSEPKPCCAALGRVEEIFSQKIRPPKPEDIEVIRALLDKHSEDSVLRAIEEASRTGGKSAAYLAAILARWKKVPGKDAPKREGNRTPTYDLGLLDSMDLMMPPEGHEK